MTALALALAAGVASGLIGEKTFELFQPPAWAVNMQQPADLDTVVLNREVGRANARNGAAVFGGLGGLLGLALGLAGGLTGRSVRGAVRGGVAGLVLGGAAGALPAFAVMPWYWGHHGDDKALTPLLPLLFHAALWSALGAAAGLAYALGRDRPNPIRLIEGALGGWIGAVSGAFVYEVLGTLLFAQDRPDETFATTAAARLAAHLCAAVFVALGAALVADSPPHKPKTADSSGI
jgi:hypothetical protein